MIETLSPPPAELASNTQDSLELQAGFRRMEEVRNLGGKAVESYFHGTIAQLGVGDRIRPGDQAILDESGRDNASATTAEDLAWAYAESRDKPGGLRPRVYEVVPADGEPVKRLGPQRGEVNSPEFRVVGVVDIKPGEQGTFPDVNWSKYSPYVGANHPGDPMWRPDPEGPPPQPDSPDQPALPGLEEKKPYMSEFHRNIPPM